MFCAAVLFLSAWNDLKCAPLCSAHSQRKNIFYRAMPERLRTLRHCIFTGGVVKGSGSCSAAFYESAALRESAAGLRPLSQNLTVLPALPKGEPRALPKAFSLHLKLQQQASDLGSPFGGAGAGAPERAFIPPQRNWKKDVKKC